MIGGTSTCLIAAGLPPCYWIYASPCFCFGLNTQSLHGISPWEKTHGTPFLHQRYPFGWLVIFKPNEVRTTDHKWAPKAEWGIFAGYQLHSGYTWKGEYLVWRLSEFRRADLMVSATKHKQRGVALPHSTKCVVLPKSGLQFPLKKDYDRVNQAMFDQSVVNLDEDAVTMAHPFDGPGRGLSYWPEEAFEENMFDEAEVGPEDVPTMVHGPLPDLDDPVEKRLPGREELLRIEIEKAKSEEEVLKAFNRQTFDHVRNGYMGDGVIYVDDSGSTSKLDRRGTRHGCDIDGHRNTMRSKRPADMSPEVWKTMGPHMNRKKKQAEKAAKQEPQVQVAPVEGSVIKLDVIPNSSDPPDHGGIFIISGRQTRRSGYVRTGTSNWVLLCLLPRFQRRTGF